MTKNIVIAGAGYGGLRTALDLARGLRRKGLSATYEVILIDRNESHVYTPLLYKLAGGKGLREEDLAYSINNLVQGTGIRFIQDEVRELDLAQGDLHLGRGEELRLDYLALAPGSERNYFDIPGLQENSLSLKSLADARVIRDKLKVLPPTGQVIVGGGGPTGIELAAEIRGTYSCEVILVEAMPLLLPGFDPRLQKLAETRLKELGVRVLTNTVIASVETDRLSTKNPAMPNLSFNLLIWTGGVKTPAWVTGLPIKTEARGRIEATSAMECLPRSEDLRLLPRTPSETSFGNEINSNLNDRSRKGSFTWGSVYALGDVVCVYDKNGKPMPGVAPSAIEQGKIVAVNIISDILSAEGRTKVATHKSYQAVHYPYVLPIGDDYAIGNIGSFILRGLPAFIFEELIHLNYLISIMPFFTALRTWLKNY